MNNIEQIKNNLLKEETLYDVAELFKIFGDSTRVRILATLLQSELCVYDIANILNMNQSAISHQLRILKTNHLIKGRREGRNIYYSLDDDHVRIILNAGLDHVGE